MSAELKRNEMERASAAHLCLFVQHGGLFGRVLHLFPERVFDIVARFLDEPAGDLQNVGEPRERLRRRGEGEEGNWTYMRPTPRYMAACPGSRGSCSTSRRVRVVSFLSRSLAPSWARTAASCREASIC
jgi:hypothetical protein